jgi:hypothetical protein
VDDYRRGLIEAQEAVRLMPKRATMINTLGVAQFRVGDYEDALSTLTHADEVNRKPDNLNNGDAPPGLGDPSDVAFIAMTLHKLRRTDEARAAMERLHALMDLDYWRKDSGAQEASREAKDMVR